MKKITLLFSLLSFTFFNSYGQTPRADALASSGLPYYFTFEADDAGLVLEPFIINADGSPYGQGVDITYGVANPDGTPNDLVAQVIRPDDWRFGGFEDYKFQTLATPVDFSNYHKFKLDVYVPSSNDFSGQLQPLVVLNLHDYIDGNFWQRWTQISYLVDPSDFDQWITIEFDGTTAAAADTGVLLPAQTTYTNFSLQFGGGGHGESGTFYVKDFVPIATTLSTVKLSKTSFKTYPNPTQNNWIIKAQNIEISTIDVYDVFGKNVLSITPNDSQATIEGENLVTGLYFAEIKTTIRSETVKLVKN